MSKTSSSKRLTPSRWGLVLVLVIAAACRFWQLTSLPPGLHPDEAQFGLLALGDDATGLSQVIASVFMRVWDATPWALRASSALAGVLLVWGTYLAAATLFPPDAKKTNWLPVAAAFLTAFFYPALSLSRLGMGFLWGAVLPTWAVTCFWHGFNLHHLSPAESDRSRRRSRWPIWWQRFILSPDVAFALTGILLGAAAYSQMGVSLFLLVAFGFMLFRPGPLSPALLPARAKGASPPPARERGRVRGIVVLFGLWVLVLLFFSVIWGWPFAAWDIHGPSLAGFSQILAGLFWSGSTELTYNLPGRPFLDAIQIILLLIGFGVTIRQGRQSRHLFLLLWLGMALLSAVLSGEESYWALLLDAAAPLAILMVRGLAWLSEQLPVISNQLLRRPLLTAHFSLFTVYCLLITSAFLTTRAYFTTYAQQPALAQEFALDAWRLGQSAAAYPPETLLYLSPPSAHQPTMQFALPDPSRLWSFNPEATVLPLGRLDTPTLYLVAHEQIQLITQLTDTFPDATVSDTPVDAYGSVYLPAFVPRLPQAHLTDLLWGGEIGLVDWDVAPVDGGLEVKLYWQAAATPTQDYVAYAHLRDSEGNFVSQSETALSGYPTKQWHRQEVVRGLLRLATPPDGGPYQLVTGFLDPTTRTSLSETILTTWP